MATDIQQVEQWLTSTLRGDPQLMAAAPGGVWSYQVPQGTGQVFPVVQYTFITGQDLTTLGGERDTPIMISVKGVTDGESFAPLGPICDRLEALLTAVRYYGATLWLRIDRSAEISYAEDSTGKRYNHRGAIWRCWCSAE